MLTCDSDSLGVAVLPEGDVSPSDEAGVEAAGLHHHSAQDKLAGRVAQHLVAL